MTAGPKGLLKNGRRSPNVAHFGQRHLRRLSTIQRNIPRLGLDLNALSNQGMLVLSRPVAEQANRHEKPDRHSVPTRIVHRASRKKSAPLRVKN